MTRGTSAEAAAATRAAPLRLTAWPTSSVATLAREGPAPAYTAAPSTPPSEPDRAVSADRLDDLLDGLQGGALVAVADRVVSRLATEALTDGEAALAASVHALHRLGRRVSAEWHRRIAELDERDAWQALRCRSTGDWLTSTLSLTTYEARTAVEVARVLGELPETAARFAAGQIDAAIEKLDAAIALLGGGSSMRPGPERDRAFARSLAFAERVASPKEGASDPPKDKCATWRIPATPKACAGPHSNAPLGASLPQRPWNPGPVRTKNSGRGRNQATNEDSRR